jgi:hypothetical protein
VAGGAVLVVARARTAAVAPFLRYAAVAGIVFLVQFAWASPSSSLIWRDRSAGASDTAALAAVDAAVDDDAPPIVMVVLDELPTATLLDGSGNIDADLFPNIARLAADGTWYRNHSTVADSTPVALGAILTGRYPDADRAPTAATYRDNLFMLLADEYDVNALEQVTALCPSTKCPPASGSPSQVPSLMADTARFWARYMARGGAPGIPTRSEDRLAEVDRWVADLSFDRSSRPDLYFMHTILPHAGWEYLPDGTRYRAEELPTGADPSHVWSERGTVVGRQRHVLQTQAVDRTIGELLDRLESSGVYDDALVVLTADHGTAFVPGEPRRAASEAQYEQIAWTPLIVKEPHQRAGAVNDDNAQNIDILPTVLDILGVEGVELDGRSLSGPGGSDVTEKWMIDSHGTTELGRAAEDGRIELDADVGLRRVLGTAPLPGGGPDGAWQLIPGSPLVGRRLGDLRVGEPAAATVDAGFGDAFQGLSAGARVALEIDTTADVDAAAPVVAVVNGVVSGSTLAERVEGASAAHVQVMVRPDALARGDNEVQLYLVDGPPGHETLHLLEPR